MMRCQIQANNYLSSNTNAFYHLPYTRMGQPGNPDYLNYMKNTFNDYPQSILEAAVHELQNVLREDLPQIFQSLGFEELTVCVVPRAKAEETFHANQQLFRTTVQTVIDQLNGFVDGTHYLRRHTNTRTTHLNFPIQNYNNDGLMPYPGITRDTCVISPNIRGRNILLIDDIYTPGVNIDEDIINALIMMGARIVTFYSVGRVQPRCES